MADMLEYYQQISELKKAVRERLALSTLSLQFVDSSDVTSLYPLWIIKNLLIYV